tara:strand:- start:6122 stop:7384 length:1263 start_codon:yes stop_codon:yes gene_type:complete
MKIIFWISFGMLCVLMVNGCGGDVKTDDVETDLSIKVSSNVSVPDPRPDATIAVAQTPLAKPTAAPTVVPSNVSVPTPRPVPTIVLTQTPTPRPTAVPTTKPQLLPTPLSAKPILKPNNSQIEYEIAVAEIYKNIPRYSRSEWNHWIDTDKDCQNARHEVLIEESLEPVEFKTDKKCQVKSGKWFAVYSGQEVTDATKLDIDHMVPLKNAHDSGGWSWDKDRKKAFANDMEYQDHLIAVTASANRKKGAKGPEGWKPSNKDYWCDYAIDWIKIKMDWDLTATQLEWEALQGMLKTCENPPSVIVVPSKVKSPAVLKTAVTTASEPGTVGITSVDCKGKPEKIVITNADESIANLTGWKIEDEGPKHKFEFPKEFLLKAGSSVEIISGTTGENTDTEIYWKNQPFGTMMVIQPIFLIRLGN